MLYPYQVLLNDFFIQHFSEIFLAVYLLSYLVYAVAFTESANLASPNLLSSTNSFSVFVLFTILATISIIIQECGFNTLCCSFFSFFFKFLVIVSSISVLLISKSFLASQNIHKYEYDLLIIFSVLSLIILGSSDDFLLVYLAIELQSLCFYVLATFQRNSEFSTEAGLKYFVLGSFSSGFLLLGFVLTYSTFGTINFESLSRLVESDSNNLAFWGYVFIMAALFFKVGSVPFHMWLCDVYEGSTTSVTAFFAIVPKIILFGLIIQLSFFVFKNFDTFSSKIVLFCGLSSICLASTAALYQKRIKRLLAYSTISHTGFILLGIGCVSIDSLRSCVIYVALYFIMNLATFSIILLLTSGKKMPKYLVAWTSISQCNALLTITLALTLFSTAGIPPLAGFWSKLGILFSTISEGYAAMALLVVLFSSVACFYYIRLIKIFFFTPISCFWFNTSSAITSTLLGSSVSVIIFFLAWPNSLLNFSTIAALTLL